MERASHRALGAHNGFACLCRGSAMHDRPVPLHMFRNGKLILTADSTGWVSADARRGQESLVVDSWHAKRRALGGAALVFGGKADTLISARNVANDINHEKGDGNMIDAWKPALLGMTLCILALPVNAQSVTRLESPNPGAVIASAVTVPAGYTTYYISGIPGGPKDPSAPEGSPARWGDTAQQTNDVLTKLEAVLTKLGLNFGDVVKATVFLVGDPAKGGDIDFAAMNREWGKRFGSATQPNKPARSTVKVGLATPGALVEIELVAVKK